MRYVGDICYGGTRYGYIHQQKRSKHLKQKIAKLKEFGCTEIACDIGNRKNLDKLLAKATLRDHIYFYDHSVFQTHSELLDIYDLGMGAIDGSPSFRCDFYDRDTLFDLAHTPEDTAKYRKRHARQRRFNVALNWFLKPLSLSFK
ncbi:MAG: hypothetical protein COA74_11660 [Gammaproteobacteria bacterium]|nr:MAG: hypothetical protein COA74_11660 [Gammaproteobacteria bacterium]